MCSVVPSHIYVALVGVLKSQSRHITSTYIPNSTSLYLPATLLYYIVMFYAISYTLDFCVETHLPAVREYHRKWKLNAIGKYAQP